MNPNEQLDMRLIFESSTPLDIDGKECWKISNDPAEPQGPFITNDDEVTYNISTFGPQGHKTVPHVYSATQNRKIKLFGTEVPVYPIIRPALLSMAKKEVVFVKLEPHEHKILSRKDEIFLRIEAVEVKKHVLPYNQQPLPEKITNLATRKLEADELFKKKDFSGAVKLYLSLVNDYSGLPKKERKTADPEILKEYDDIGLRIYKNYTRCCVHTENFDEALKAVKYIERHITPDDWIVCDITLHIFLKKKEWEIIHQKLIEWDAKDKSTVRNWNPTNFEIWKEKAAKKSDEDRTDKLFAKALKSAIKNEEIEKKREKVFSLLQETGQRLLIENSLASHSVE